MPVSDEVYVFARSCRTFKEAASKLICSQTTAKALRKDDRSLRVTPLELASMEMQVRRLTSLTALRGLVQTFRNPPKSQLKYIEFMRSVAVFAVDHSDQLDKFKRKCQFPRVHSAVAWHRPLYALADMMSHQIIPHMRQTWWDFPECREMFFGGTGFEEKYIKHHKRHYGVKKEGPP